MHNEKFNEELVDENNADTAEVDALSVLDSLSDVQSSSLSLANSLSNI